MALFCETVYNQRFQSFQPRIWSLASEHWSRGPAVYVRLRLNRKYELSLEGLNIKKNNKALDYFVLCEYTICSCKFCHNTLNPTHSLLDAWPGDWEGGTFSDQSDILFW